MADARARAPVTPALESKVSSLVETHFLAENTLNRILRARKSACYTDRMEHRDRLRSLADDELLAGLSPIVGRRNQITAEFLACLAELDQRQLFLDLGYPSLFDYCVKALGLCESTAGRHIAAARVCRSYPQALDQVARGGWRVLSAARAGAGARRSSDAEWRSTHLAQARFGGVRA